MNIFRSDKAPYIVGLLVTLLGWHIAQLVEDLRSAKSLTYSVSVEGHPGRVTAYLRNVSKTNAIVGARFTLACAPDVSCLVADTQKVVVQEPHLITASDIISASDSIQVETSLAAGAALSFGAQLSGRGSDPKFYFMPGAENTLDIYLIKRWSVRGVLVENQFAILFTSFVILIILLVVIAFTLWRQAHAKGTIDETS